MAKERFDVRLDVEDIEELKLKAKKLDITASALARIFIKNALSEYSPENLKLLDSVNLIASATASLEELLMGNLFLASRGLVDNLPKAEGESAEDYKQRQAAELMRLINVAMRNTPIIRKNLKEEKT